jgi:hypothetical protein
MLTTYERAVTAAIEYFANTIAEGAHDSVAERSDYGIFDSADSINWIMGNYTQFDTVAALANAALSSTLDTVVRENIHYALTEN